MSPNDELTFNQKKEILKDVILREDPPKGETPAAAAWRKLCERDCEAIRASGGMPEIPDD